MRKYYCQCLSKHDTMESDCCSEEKRPLKDVDVTKIVQKWLAFHELKYRTDHKEDNQERVCVWFQEAGHVCTASYILTLTPFLRQKLQKLPKTKEEENTTGNKSSAASMLPQNEWNVLFPKQNEMSHKALRNHVWWQRTALYFSVTFL